jgi:O-antigen/teichoic acid export membrane protein
MFFAAVGFGIETYVMKEVSVRPKHASDFVGGIFALRSLLSLALFVAMGVTLYVTHRPEEVQTAAVVFGLSQLVMSFNATLATVLQATAKIDRLAVTNIVAKFIWGGGLLLGLHFNAPLYVLAMPALAAELLRLGALVPAAKRAADLRYTVQPRVVRGVIVASVPFFMSAIAIGLGNNLSMNALEYMARDPREEGWYNVSQNLATLAMVLSPVLFAVVMPLLSRAHSRSEEEMMSILRRAIEGLVLLIAPVTVAISVSSELLIRLVFKPEYAPAATGTSVLSLVFGVTYVNMVLSSALVVLGRGWSVTVTSLLGVLSMTGFMLVFVPIGRYLFGVGGEAAGAAMAYIANEACVVVALTTRFPTSPLDGRNVRVILKTATVAGIVIVSDRFLRRFGLANLAVDAARLVADAVLYAVLAFALGMVRVADVRRVIELVRNRRQVAAGQEA